MGARGHKLKLISQFGGKKRFVLVCLNVRHWVDNKQVKKMVTYNIEAPIIFGTNPSQATQKGIDLSKVTNKGNDLSKATKKGIDLLEDVEKGICPKGNQFLKSCLEGDQPIRNCPKGRD
jgi:hypothetical protein